MKISPDTDIEAPPSSLLRLSAHCMTMLYIIVHGLMESCLKFLNTLCLKGYKGVDSLKLPMKHLILIIIMHRSYIILVVHKFFHFMTSFAFNPYCQKLLRNPPKNLMLSANCSTFTSLPPFAVQKRGFPLQPLASKNFAFLLACLTPAEPPI